MYFNFDGVSSSDFNLAIGAYDGVVDDARALNGAITYNTVKAPRRTHWNFSDSVYDEPLSFSFPICKVDCNDINDKSFSRSEIAEIMMWLVKDDGYGELSFDDDEYEDTVYICTIALEEQIVGEEVVGFNATVTCNAPWAWSNLKTYNFAGNSFTIESMSEQYGVIYPSAISITLGGSGNLILTNTVGDKDDVTIVKNCYANEQIVFDINHAIYSSTSHLNLADDFNGVFPGIYRTRATNVNHYSSNISCDVTLSYREVRKGVAV